MVRRIAAGCLVTCCLLPPAISFAQGPAPGAAPPGAAGEKSLEQRVEDLEKAQTAHDGAVREQERLEQRVEELETAQTANEDATRSIIAQALVGLGSKINAACVAR